MFGLMIATFLGIYTQFKPISQKYFKLILIIPYGISEHLRSFVLYNQLVEYFAIFYLIFSQRNRNINEILFDFNHEPIGQKISKD